MLINNLNDPFLGLFLQFRIDWESKGLPGSQLAVRKISFPISKITKAFLKVDGNRIVDLYSDLGVAQGLDDLVALRDANHELVVDMASVWGFRREDNRSEFGLGKESTIGGGIPLSRL